MALFKKTKESNDLFEILETYKGKSLQEVSFEFERGTVKVFMKDGRVIATTARDFFPMNINARTYWSQNIDDNAARALMSVEDFSGPDEGFVEYVSILPQLSDTLADYYLSKEISIIRWLNNQFKAGRIPPITAKKSTSNLMLAEGSYAGSGYSTLTVEDLKELVELEDNKIVDMNNRLHITPSDYPDVVFKVNDHVFDNETPFENDAENFILGAAFKEATLEQVRNLSNGFLWSSVLEAAKTLENSGIILNSSKISSFFEQEMALAIQQGMEEARYRPPVPKKEQGLPELNIEDTFSLPPLEENDIDAALSEPIIFENVSVEEDREITTEHLEEEVAFDEVEINSFEISEPDVPLEEEPALEDSFEFDLSLDDDFDAPVVALEVESPQVEEVVTEVISENSENVPETTASNEDIEMAITLSKLVPMAMSLSKQSEESIDEMTAILEENIFAERSYAKVSSEVEIARADYYTANNSFMGNMSEDNKDKLNAAWTLLENLEKDRSELIASYLDNLHRVEDTLESMSNMKEARGAIRSRITALQDIENTAYYSPEEQLDDFGPYDDIIQEALDGDIFEKYNKSVEEEIEVIQRAVDPYSEEILSEKVKVDFTKNSPIFDKMISGSGLEHLFS